MSGTSPHAHDQIETGGSSRWMSGWSARRLPRWTCLSVSAVLAASLLQAGAEPAVAAPVAAPKAAVDTGPLVRPDEMSARVTARSSGRRVEVENLRTETTTTWVEPDGLLSSELHGGQIRFKTPSGQWRDVDLTLAEGEDGALAPRSVDSPVSFAGASTAAERSAKVSDVAEVAEGRPIDEPLPEQAADPAAAAKAAQAVRKAPGATVDRRVTMKWPGALPEPVVEGAVDSPSGQWAVYRDVQPGVDMRMMALRTGFEQHIVIKERPAAGAVVSWTLPLDLAGLTPRTAEDGPIEFLDAAGTVVSRLSAPAAWDSSGGGTVTARGTGADAAPVGMVALKLLPATDTADAQVTVVPDAAWLADPARVFPVVVDPTYTSVTVGVVFDTFIRNGLTTGQSASTQLEIGTQNSGANVARSYLTFNTNDLRYKTIVSANLTLNQISAPSCTQTTWQLYTAGRANINTVWGPAAPDLVDLKGTSTHTKGYDTSCPAGRVGMDVKDFIQNASDNGYAEAGAGLRAGSETSNSGHKIFRSSDSSTPPVIAVKYDRKPGPAAAPTVKYTRSWNNTTYVAKTDPFLGSVASDPDGDTVHFSIQVRTAKNDDSTSLVTTCTTGYIASGGTPVIPGSTSTATSGPGWCRPSGLSDNTTYHARVATFDGRMWNGTWSPWATFTVGATQPLAPTVSCPSPYSNGSWQDTVPAAEVSCTVNVPTSTGHTGANAPIRALVSIDGGIETAYSVTPSSTAAVAVKVPATGGGHSIVARSQTASSWVSPTITHTFGYGTGIISPVNGATSNDAFTLSAAITAPTSGTVSGKLQWRTSGSSTATWTDSTTALTPVIASGGAAVNGVVWRAGNDITGDAARTPQLLDIQVCFTFSATSATTCTWNAANPTTVLKVPHAFGNGYPTADAGPGQVALFTGEVNMSATDVSVPGYTGDLSVSRSHATFNGPTDAVTGVFGPGWVAGLEGPEAGAAGVQVVDATGTNGTIALVDEDGSALIYRQPSKGRTALETGTYTPVGEDTILDGSKLVLSTTGTGTAQIWTLTFTEDDGTVTTFRRGTATSSMPQWGPHEISEPGITGKTAYSRDSAGRVTRIIASPPPGVTCPASGALVAGCRALEITYATTTTATSTTNGDVAGQVKQIAMVIFDPDKAGGPGMTTTPVATYLYNGSNRLVSITDPRSNLSTQYGYAGTNGSQTDPVRITSVTPAGLKAFRLEYTAAPYKLSTVSRDDVAGGSTPSRLNTFVYDIDATAIITGLPDVRATEVAKWGQGKAPVKGYAVFGADRTPAGTTPSTVTAADWPFADLQYTDGLGYTVNTASYGAGAWQRTATDYDAKGTVVRSWDTRGIAAALADVPAAADMYATTLRFNADILSGTTVVTPAGMLVTDTWGPARDVLLADGSTRNARLHTNTVYDEGAPNSGINADTGQPFRLATKVTVGAAGATVAPTDPATPVPADLETVSTTTTSYDKIDATVDPDTWKLGLPTKQTTVVDGTTTNDITRITRYDAEGKAIQSRMPKSNGSDAGTSNTTYYTASGTYNPSTAPCSGKPEWAGLICRTAPAGAPDTGPTLPSTLVSKYSALLSPVTVVHTSGSSTRTTATTFLADGRPATVTTTSSGITGSTAVPATTTTYDTTTGLATKVSTSATDYVQTGYDAWGRPTSYRNSLGETTTTTYVAIGSAGAGAVNVVTDPKGTTTYGYGDDANGAPERRGMPTSVTVSGAGTFTGAYDAGGTLTTQTMPGGITQKATLDSAGEPVGLSYSGDVTTDGTTATGIWVAWAQLNDIAGRVRQEWIPEGSAVVDDDANAFDRQYTYDKAGRLTTVKDRTSPLGALPTDSTDADWAAAACTTRTYAFDKNGNRTTLTTHPGATDSTCQTSTGATTKTWTSDTADRITTGSGYTYDSFGRATTIPATDSPSGAALTLGYYDTDAARTITTGTGSTGTTTTHTLDASGRRLQATTTPASGGTATATVIRHYVNGSDNPGWIADTTVNTLTRYAQGLDGNLSTEITTTGVTTTTPITTTKITLIDPHGDLAATATIPLTGNATGIDSWSDTTEYGLPRTGTTTPTDPGRYNWLGGKQRATDTTGLLLMGARLYNPATGQFTSLDSLPGGNETNYNYPNDPINKSDLDGRWPEWAKKAAGWAWEHKTEIAQAAIFTTCVIASAGTCAVAGALYAGARYAYNANRYGATSRRALGQAAVDTASIFAGFGLGRAAGLLGKRGAREASQSLRKYVTRSSIRYRPRGRHLGGRHKRAVRSRVHWRPTLRNIARNGLFGYGTAIGGSIVNSRARFE